MRELQAWVLGYLVNALWQAPVVLCAAWAMARATRRFGNATQHRIWVSALLAEAVLPACPAFLVQSARVVWAGLLSAHSQAAVRVAFGPGLIGGGGLRLFSPTVSAMLLTVYGSAILYFAARLAWGLWRTHTLRLRSEPLESPNKIARSFEVRLSSEIAGPATVGLRRGVVLLPHGFLDRVTGEDLRAVLAHEGAHVLRRDFLKNVLYGLATLPVAFHPALWVTRRRMAESREVVCDAMAAEVMAGSERYAESLLRLASMRVAGTPERMLHAIGILGFFDANSFERRVMNLTGNRTEMKGARRTAVAVACAMLALGTCATALAFRVGVPAQSGFDQGTTAAPAAKVSGAVMAGQVISKVNPVYPPDAKEARISGAVVLRAIIGRDGAIENLQVVSGPEKLRMSALDAVRQWTYKPYLLNGVAVPVETTITVNYSFGQ